MRALQKLTPDSGKPSSPARTLAILLACTALVLSPVLFADFIRLDDYSHLFDNPNLRRMSAAGLAAFWTKSYFNLYIPITYSVWWAVAMIGHAFGTLQQNAWIFHALNLAVHLVNAALVFFVVQRLLRVAREKIAALGEAGSTTVALISALFFALHPVQVETVAWVSELKGELSAMFGLLGLWWYTRSGKRVLPAAFFVAAMLSKPSAIVFPGVVLLVNRILLGNSLRKSAVMPALFSLPLLPLVFVAKHLQPDLELNFIPTVSQRFLVASDALAFYVFKILVPFPLALDYGRSPQYVLSHVPGWQMALSALLLVSGVAVVVHALVRPRPSAPDGDWYSFVSCGWSIFVMAAAPVLGFIPFGFQEVSTVADHYLYVSLLRVSLVVAGILMRLRASAKSRHIATVVLVVFAGLSFQQARLWRSTETLFAHTVKVNPRSYLGHYSIADELIHTRRFDESIEESLKALAINPNYLNAEIALGLAWLQKGDYAKAIEQYSSALAKNPSIVGTRARPASSLHNNLGMVLLSVGRGAEAIEHFRKAVEIFPRSVNGHLNLGNAALKDERYLDAIAEYEIAQALNPGDPRIGQRLDLARQGARRALLDDKSLPPSP